MILNIENNEISRISPTRVTLNVAELRDELIPNVGSELYNTDKWTRVTFSYVSSVYQEQTQNLIFNISNGVSLVEIYHILPTNFISEMKLSSITIYGEDGLNENFRREVLDTVKFDIASDSLPAPVSDVIASNNTKSGFLSLSDITLWETSFFVRLYDKTTGEPLVQFAMIETIHLDTGEFILDRDLDLGISDMVLESANGNKFLVGVTNDGILTSELNNTLVPSTKFKILKKGTTNEFYTIKVDNGGTLFIDRAILSELDYPTLNRFTILAPNESGWTLNITENNKLQTETVTTTLEGLEMRFAYHNEVTLDQLKRFKFG